MLKTALAELGAVRVQGADAVRFLQGQVSNDVALLTAGTSMLAGLHNPQGRVIALLRLVLAGEGDVIGVLPRDLAAPVAARLAKYVLRAKAKVTDASVDWELPALASVGPELASHSTAARIAAGIPQVYAATSEQFVAQMLNLDAIGAISFTKGCYTGQEVIARAHYRGRVKRRMQRFRTLAPATLGIGDTGKLRDGRGFRVVEATQLADGRCEFLAVAPIGRDEDAPETSTSEAGTASVLDAEPLALPYALPE